MSGMLADGTPFAQTAYITADDWPLYVSMYVGKGARDELVDLYESEQQRRERQWGGSTAGASATSYPAGFTVGTKAVGSVLHRPEATGKP